MIDDGLRDQYLNRSQIHWMFNDVVIVVKMKAFHIYRLIEGPGIGGVFLGEKFFEYCTAILHLFRHLSLLGLRDVLCGVGQVFRWLFDGSAALAARRHLTGLSLAHWLAVPGDG